LAVIGIPLGIAYSHLVEWGLHRYLLHGPGKIRGNAFSFHFFEHHRAARTHLGEDPIYEGSIWRWNAAGKELAALAGLMLLHLPLVLVVPFFVATNLVCAHRYYRLHKRAHLDPTWCRENLPWHYDHHMGPNQDMNYGVTTDWVDRLMGTREIYLGSQKEVRDTVRRMAVAQAQAG
jgi:hypothetical protein